MNPTVYLIGAGPGDPDLLTLRGAKCLLRSQVVLYDGLSNAEILALAPDAEHICVGKHGQTRIWKQDEIIEEMLRHARLGKSVARLKGGDPAVFARTAEEVDALNEAEIPFEIVPGITAALAAGSYAGIPITHRKLASAVALVTGHEEPGKPESALDWDALARFPGTLVIYMGVTTAKIWTQALIAAGKDPATPTALVRRCSLPDQATIRCRLDEVQDRLNPPAKFRPPVIAIVGPVSTLADTMSWVHHRPLHAQTILVTRPKDQSAAMVDAIGQQGGTAIVAPAIDIRPLEDHTQLDHTINSLPDLDELIFCSTNAVDYFFARLKHLGADSRRLAGPMISVIGRKTNDALLRHGIHADRIPEDFCATSLLNLLRDSIAGRQVAIIRADRGSNELPRGLCEAGGIIHETAAYRNADVTESDPNVVAALQQGKIDWITVTSSATAKNLVRLYGDDLRQAKIAALSPITATAMESEGFPVAATANPYTIESLLDEIARLS